MEKSSQIDLGDVVEVVGKLTIPNSNTIPNLFNYQKYLYYHKIYYIAESSSVTKIANNTNIIYFLRKAILNKIDKIPKVSHYIKIFLLGDNSSIDDNIQESYRQNGISHLFSISGMHISLFISIIFYFLKRISYNNYYNYSIAIIFLFFYAALINFPPSVVRSLTMFIIFSINKLFNLKINKIDLMGLVLIILLIINPYYLYNISFQYSYVISFSLVFFSNRIKKIHNKILLLLYTSFISFLVSFPICIYYFYQVNFLSILTNIFFIPFVSMIVFPLSIIVFFFPKIFFILNILIRLMEKISMFIYQSNLGIITFAKPNIIIILLYYVLIYMFLYNYKNIYIFFLILSNKFYIYFNSSIKFIYLDVGQGDSIFIKYPYNKNNILIDTGGLKFSNYSIFQNRTLPYLKSIGITKLNYLIITHGDYDHIGEAINLVNNFKVENVIFNVGDYNKLEKNLIKVLKEKRIPYYQNVDSLDVGQNKLYFLNTKIYDNENDNSSVIYTKINNKKVLLMGDAGKAKELDIIDKYNIKDIDILKVGHHGSDTSSSREFIDVIKPQTCIISVGKNNRFGHPKTSVIDTLDDYCDIYRTDINGSISIKIK